MNYHESQQCRHIDGEKHSYIELVDGGIYDNRGYLTALDILRTVDTEHKVLLVIDSSATVDRWIEEEDPAKDPTYIKAVLDAGFPARSREFEREAHRRAAEVGASILVLDFASASGAFPAGDEYSQLRSVMNKIKCWHPDTEQSTLGSYKEPEDGNLQLSEDCRLNNAWRAGASIRTDYIVYRDGDSPQWDAAFELGLFVTRKNRDKILLSFFGNVSRISAVK